VGKAVARLLAPCSPFLVFPDVSNKEQSSNAAAEMLNKRRAQRMRERSTERRKKE
jgi:hypothetical protein